MTKDEKVGLFVRTGNPIVFLGWGTFAEPRIPEEHKNNVILKVYKHLNKKCPVVIAEDGTELFYCEVIVCDEEETNRIHAYEYISLPIQEFLKIKKEINERAETKS